LALPHSKTLARCRGAHRVEPDDEAPVWSVFTNPDALQRAMTAQVCANVNAKYGVQFLAPAAF